jgi:hypothetical protein
MRYVPYDPAKLDLRAGWKEDAEAAEQEVQDAAPDDKSKAINNHSNLWRDVKPELKKIFHGKCWYTESPQAGTDVDVDHYRPKGRVAKTKKGGTDGPHPGYWWLAFKLENYRYSCIYANRQRRDVETGKTGGKADNFPLCDENNRAWCPEDDCFDEQPLLLDPCKRSDVALLTFKDDGEAMPRFAEEDRKRSFDRAEASIKYYNLNHSDFKKARIAIRDELSKRIENAERYFKKLETGDAGNDLAYEEAIRDLRKARSEKSPYSSYAIAFLDSYRTRDSLTAVFM